MTDENLIVIKEEEFAVNLAYSHRKGACILANGTSGQGWTVESAFSGKPSLDSYD